MTKWTANLRHHLRHRPVTILHGNVRDVYVEEGGRVFDNLTSLLQAAAPNALPDFSQFVYYDVAAGQRQAERCGQTGAVPPENSEEAFDTTAPEESTSGSDASTARTLATWNDKLRTGAGLFYVFQYLDKCISYKKSYTEEEQLLLLWLEKTIENISDGNRLVLVALQDSMVPIELYTHSPKAGLFAIPRPGMGERTAYLRHRITASDETLGLLAGLTDGLFLRELHPIADEIAEQETSPTQRELRRLVNKYRVGEQEDYWGQLDIDRLGSAYEFFVESEGVKGQDYAVGKVIDTLCLARAGLSGVSSGTLAKPRGVLFFAGPTGVGKTLIAKKLAKFLFTTEEAFLRFDMSEFKEEHTVSKMIGSPPGYVGFEQGGALTNGIREKPFCVVLFDEIEKAHPKILDIYLQILDDGRLTDSRGQTVYFTDTMIVFTSNIGTRSVDSRGAVIDEHNALQELLANQDIDAAERRRRIQTHFTEAVRRFFAVELSRPELLNRIGNRIVPFDAIDSVDTQRAIVTSHLRRIEADVADRYRRQRFQVRFCDSVTSWLVESFGARIAQFGGRGITNTVEDEILIPLARKLLQAEDNDQHDIQLECDYSAEHGRLKMSNRKGLR